jgi:serine/threonine protein kinase
MKKLSNPHVVKIIDVLADTYDTELYIILEYCEGGDLRKLLEKHKRFNE